MKVFIDNNFWDYLSKNNIELGDFFSPSKFQLLITTHGRYEILQMPISCSKLRNYALKNIGSVIKEDKIFGFKNNYIPEEYQRLSGFDKGRLLSSEERDILKILHTKYGSSEKRKSELILFKQEADIEIAARSLFHPVITFDIKRGPIRYVSDIGGKAIYLNQQKSQLIPVSHFMNDIVSKVLDYKA